jgi:hypothetical protein
MKVALSSPKRRFLQDPHGVNIPEDTILHSHCREDLKSYTVKPDVTKTHVTFMICITLPANANCIMKKLIRDFLFILLKSASMTDELPTTMSANRIHRTANCSV